MFRDCESLRRLAFILIENAVQYNVDGGRVDVSLFNLDGEAMLSFSETASACR